MMQNYIGLEWIKLSKSQLEKYKPKNCENLEIFSHTKNSQYQTQFNFLSV